MGRKRRFCKRVLAWVMCLVMILPVLPFTEAAADNADFNSINSVNLKGVNEILNAGKVKQYDHAVDIGDGEDSRYYIESVYCMEAYDESYLYDDEQLLPGIEYDVVIYIKANKGYAFSHDEKDINVKMDGVQLDVKDYYSYISGSDTVPRGLRVTCHVKPEGESPEYVKNIDMTVREKPIMGATPSVDTDACTVPEDAPYMIKKATWRYYGTNNTKMQSKDFTESSKFFLRISLEKKSGENIRFASENKTVLNIEGNKPTGNCHVNKKADGSCDVDLFYDVEAPPTYTVTYDPCGGKFPGEDVEIFKGTTRQDGTVSHMWNKMYKEGYSFKGWYTLPTGGEKITSESKFYGPVTLYAQWVPCVDKVYIENVALPADGKKPIFSAKVPDGADYSIVIQRWSVGNKGVDNFRTVSSMLSENAMLKEYEKEYGKEMLLKSFDGSKIYQYSVQLKAKEGIEFGDNVKIYINGKFLKEEEQSGEDLSVENIFDCVSPNSLEVYEGAKVQAGICGTAIETFDLGDYVREKSACTYEASDDMPSWLSLSDDGKLTGTRPGTEQETCTFEVTVTEGTVKKTMNVEVGKVSSEWEITYNPEVYVASDCGQSAYFAVETNATSPTYSWEIFIPENSNWYPISSIAPILGLEFESSGNVMSIKSSSENPVDLSGTFYRCKVTSEATTKTSKSARLTVAHKYADCVATNGKEETSHTYTCTVCGAKKSENHSFYYKLVKEATDEESGKYTATCDTCNKSFTRAYTKGISSKVSVKLDFNDADLPAENKTVLQTQYTNVRPLNSYPVRNGFVFQGWATKKDATNAVYGPEERVFLAGNIDLYAVWKPVDVVVNGVTVTMENMSDVLGDKTVSYVPATSKRKATLILNGANLESKYHAGINKNVAIYSSNPIEIKLLGEKNVITVTGSNSVGIFGKDDLMLLGTNLLIKGISSYSAGIEAKQAQLGADNLSIKDAKNGICADTEFFDGCTFISANEYKGGDYKAVAGEAKLYEYYDANVSAADADDEEFTDQTLASAVLMRNMKVEIKGIEKYNNLNEVELEVAMPRVGEKLGKGVVTASDEYYASVAGWYKKPANDSNYPGTKVNDDETIDGLCSSSYVVELMIQPNSGFRFVDESEIAAIVSGKSAVSVKKYGEDLTVLAEFKCNKPVHTLEEIQMVPSTTETEGCNGYYKCSGCEKTFKDASATNEITDLAAWKSGEGLIPKKEKPAATPTPTPTPTTAPTQAPTSVPQATATPKPAGSNGSKDVPNVGPNSPIVPSGVIKSQTIKTAKIKKVKASTLKKKSVVIKLKAKASGKGKLTYKVVKYPKKMKKYVKVSKKGVITLKKKAKKGSYKIKITAAAIGIYKKATKTVTIKVK